MELPSDGFTRAERQRGWVIVHLLLACYCFWLLATICDDYFVPAIETMCSCKYCVRIWFCGFIFNFQKKKNNYDDRYGNWHKCGHQVEKRINASHTESFLPDFYAFLWLLAKQRQLQNAQKCHFKKSSHHLCCQKVAELLEFEFLTRISYSCQHFTPHLFLTLSITQYRRCFSQQP